ncbi:MAG: PEP-CTERM sorting domain-containing protein [Motiliproteus sp.]
MNKILSALFLVIIMSVSAGAAAIPFTYDFGFDGSVDGFSGSGTFTVSTLTGGSLTDFSYSGFASSHAVSYNLSHVSSSNWAVDAAGTIVTLDILAGDHLFGSLGDGESSLFVGTSSLYAECKDYDIDRCNGFDDIRDVLLSGPNSGGAVTLRVPAPATFALLGIGLAGLGLSRRKRTKHS